MSIWCTQNTHFHTFDPPKYHFEIGLQTNHEKVRSRLIWEPMWAPQIQQKMIQKRDQKTKTKKNETII